MLGRTDAFPVANIPVGRMTARQMPHRAVVYSSEAAVLAGYKHARSHARGVMSLSRSKNAARAAAQESVGSLLRPSCLFPLFQVLHEDSKWWDQQLAELSAALNAATTDEERSLYELMCHSMQHTKEMLYEQQRKMEALLPPVPLLLASVFLAAGLAEAMRKESTPAAMALLEIISAVGTTLIPDSLEPMPAME